MSVRKLYNFPDQNIDRQFVELVQGINSMALAMPMADAATDLPTALVLLNQIRTALISVKIGSEA